MQKYFDIFLEFDRTNTDKLIDKNILEKKRGYVCVVDGNVLANCTKNNSYKEIINNSLVNICDGSSIAMLAGIIHRKKFKTYTGPEIFSKYIQLPYKQFFLGNTPKNLTLLKKQFIKLGYDINNFKFASLPFSNVDEFDYIDISKKINEFNPDIIWVSLGAPKQEFFISKIYPYIGSGILIGIGAAFNLYLGEFNNTRAPFLLRKLNLEWLYRVVKEPKRVGKRAINYLKLIPLLIFNEIKFKKK